MTPAPLPSIVMAVTRGRGRRGWKSPATWIDNRSRLLSQLYVDVDPEAIQTHLHVDATEFKLQMAESWDSVQRGGGTSPDADAVCAPIWERWCKLGDAAACTRLKQISKCSPD